MHQMGLLVAVDKYQTVLGHVSAIQSHKLLGIYCDSGRQFPLRRQRTGSIIFVELPRRSCCKD